MSDTIIFEVRTLGPSPTLYVVEPGEARRIVAEIEAGLSALGYLPSWPKEISYASGAVKPKDGAFINLDARPQFASGGPTYQDIIDAKNEHISDLRKLLPQSSRAVADSLAGTQVVR